MRGRKPVPSMLRELHGNPRKMPLPKHEPKPAGDLSEPPDWLTTDQKAGWAYAIANAPIGLLKRIDRSVLVVWAVAEDLHRQVVIAQSKVGLLIKVKTKATVKDDTALPMASPYLNVINQQAKTMLRAASELGFSPVSRPRIDVSPSAFAPAIDIPTDGARRRQKGRTPTLEEFLASAPKPPSFN